MAVKKKIAGTFVDEAADAVRRAGKKKIKGYRVVNVDDSGKLVSQADNRVKLSASPGDVHDQKMWVAPEEKYVLDNYSNQSYGPGEQAQAIVEYEFDIDDVIQGSLDDVEPELSIRKGRLLRVTPLKDPLDMSKAARMKRAADQGFDTDTVWYHGTNVDVPADDGHWLAANPDLANDFASYRRTWPGAQIQPEFVRGKLLDIDGGGADIRKVERMSPFLDYEKLGLNFEDAGRPGETLREYAERLGYDGIAYKNVIDEVPGTPRIVHPDDVTQVFDPSNIRSVNAAFDPAKKGSSDILAGLAGAGVVGGALGAGDLSAAESTFSASDDQNASAIEQFKARREEKKPFYDKLSDMLYAGSDVVGDFAGLMAGEVAAGSATIGRAQRDPTVTGQELEAYRDSIRESFDVEPRSEMGARWSQAAEDTIMEIIGSLARGVAPAAMAVSEPLHPIIEAAVEAYRGIPEERRKKPEVLAESYLDLL